MVISICGPLGFKKNTPLPSGELRSCAIDMTRHGSSGKNVRQILKLLMRQMTINQNNRNGMYMNQTHRNRLYDLS